MLKAKIILSQLSNSAGTISTSDINERISSWLKQQEEKNKLIEVIDYDTCLQSFGNSLICVVTIKYHKRSIPYEKLS